jgi:hypothetical protein
MFWMTVTQQRSQGGGARGHSHPSSQSCFVLDRNGFSLIRLTKKIHASLHPTSSNPGYATAVAEHFYTPLHCTACMNFFCLPTVNVKTTAYKKISYCSCIQMRLFFKLISNLGLPDLKLYSFNKCLVTENDNKNFKCIENHYSN